VDRDLQLIETMVYVLSVFNLHIWDVCWFVFNTSTQLWLVNSVDGVTLPVRINHVFHVICTGHSRMLTCLYSCHGTNSQLVILHIWGGNVAKWLAPVVSWVVTLKTTKEECWESGESV